MEDLRNPIRINVSCSWINDFTNESGDGIFQFGMDNLLEWNVDTKTKNFEPSLLRIRAQVAHHSSQSHIACIARLGICILRINNELSRSCLDGVQ